jgi:hypothetical protein
MLATPINLAVRFQDHCPEIGFIVHAPLEPKIEQLVKLIAKGMKGTIEEPVFVFGDDYQRALAAAPRNVKSKFRQA